MKAKKLAKIRGALRGVKACRDSGRWEANAQDAERVSIQLGVPVVAVALAGEIPIQPRAGVLREWEEWKDRWAVLDGIVEE